MNMIHVTALILFRYPQQIICVHYNVLTRTCAVAVRLSINNIVFSLLFGRFFRTIDLFG